MSSAKGVFYVDERVSEMPSQLWQSIEEETSLVEQDIMVQTRSLIEPYYLQLSQVNLLKTAYPHTCDRWSKETQEAFETFVTCSI